MHLSHNITVDIIVSKLHKSQFHTPIIFFGSYMTHHAIRKQLILNFNRMFTRSQVSIIPSGWCQQGSDTLHEDSYKWNYFIKVSLFFSGQIPIANQSAMATSMAWDQIGDQPSPEAVPIQRHMNVRAKASMNDYAHIIYLMIL